MAIERYKHVDCRKLEGAHYTPEILGEFLAKQIVETAELPDSIKIVDPAIGDGELILCLLRELKKHSKSVEIYGFDTNKESIEISRARLKDEFPDLKPKLYNHDFLQVCLDKVSKLENGSIELDIEVPEFDLLIANPPYIRTQALGASQAQLLAKNFGLKGRVDIYQAFLVAMRSILAPHGIAGVIVSNRFITTKGSGALREILHKQYDIKHIWDFGDTKLFEAAVLPCVLLMSPAMNEDQTSVKFSAVYTYESDSDLSCINKALDPVDAFNYEGIVSCGNGAIYNVRHGVLAYDNVPKDIWRLQDEASKKWLNTVSERTWATFKEIGKIRVGVKTTSDSVFIRKDWGSEVGYEPELLRALTTHHVSRQFKRNNKPLKSILYTHETVEGKKQVISLDSNPLSKQYLESNKEKLSSRTYVIEAGRKWYEIWVPQDPSLWEKPKVIFRDIAKEPTFWIDFDNTVVNGDCYWMVCDNESLSDDMLWLILAVANSKFIEEFYDTKFQNKLYANRRRFITQYVEQFPLPNPETAKSQELMQLAKDMYASDDNNELDQCKVKLNQLVWQSFGLL